jgi:hypothetical protein
VTATTSALRDPLTVPDGTPVHSSAPPRSIFADGVRLLALVWIIPFAILAFGLPVVGVIAVVAWAISLA